MMVSRQRKSKFPTKSLILLDGDGARWRRRKELFFVKFLDGFTSGIEFVVYVHTHTHTHTHTHAHEQRDSLDMITAVV